jgi:hypothetical protein
VLLPAVLLPALLLPAAAMPAALPAVPLLLLPAEATSGVSSDEQAPNVPATPLSVSAPKTKPAERAQLRDEMTMEN